VGWQRDLNLHHHPQAKANCSMVYFTRGTLSLLCRLNYTLSGIISIRKEKTQVSDIPLEIYQKKYHLAV